MEEFMISAITAIVCLPAGFACGVLFHRQVISEAESLRDHVSMEVATLRGELKAFVDRVAAKL